jgi:hypothetical protein
MKTNNADFKNLRTLPSGFQVVIRRERKEVTKHFAGHTPESYMAAIEHRDHLIATLPPPLQVGRPARVRRARAAFAR